MALQKKPLAKAPATDTPNFGDLSIFTSGGGIPEGNYALQMRVTMRPANKEGKVVAEGVGVTVTAYSLTDPSTEPKTRFLGFGKTVHKSFLPNADGTGLVAVPDGPPCQWNLSTNWALFLKSLEDSGMPRGIFTNDISVLDGIWVHLVNVPEPEERKGFQQSATTEVEQGTRTPQTIPNVTEILEGGSPWEGGGGIPEAKADKPNGKGTKPAIIAKSVGNRAVPPAPTPAPAQTGVSEEDLKEAAVAGITAVLEKNPNGAGKLILRTGTFKAVGSAYDDNTAQAVLNTFFASDDALNSVLGELGYVVEGQKVVPAQ